MWASSSRTLQGSPSHSVPVEDLWEGSYGTHEELYGPAYAEVLKSNIDSSAAASSATIQSYAQKNQNQQREICRFFLAGNCKFGGRCRFLHTAEGTSTVDNFPSKQFVHGPIECGICIEAPKGSLYGILSHCNCKFCLSCIRGWRTDGISVTKDNKQVRMCPLCRTQSYFVVPSSSFSVGEEKDALLQAYKESLARIPCRYYKEGICPFGSSCFYMHELDGSKGIEITKRNVGFQNLSDRLNIDELLNRHRIDRRFSQSRSGEPDDLGEETDFEEFMEVTDGLRNMSTSDT